MVVLRIDAGVTARQALRELRDYVSARSMATTEEREAVEQMKILDELLARAKNGDESAAESVGPLLEKLTKSGTMEALSDLTVRLTAMSFLSQFLESSEEIVKTGEERIRTQGDLSEKDLGMLISSIAVKAMKLAEQAEA